MAIYITTTIATIATIAAIAAIVATSRYNNLHFIESHTAVKN